MRKLYLVKAFLQNLRFFYKFETLQTVEKSFKKNSNPLKKIKNDYKKKTADSYACYGYLTGSNNSCS